MKNKYPEEFLTLINSITAKRAKTVINHIMKHGFITTEDLKNQYGYNLPPGTVLSEYCAAAYTQQEKIGNLRSKMTALKLDDLLL